MRVRSDEMGLEVLLTVSSTACRLLVATQPSCLSPLVSLGHRNAMQTIPADNVWNSGLLPEEHVHRGEQVEVASITRRGQGRCGPSTLHNRRRGPACECFHCRGRGRVLQTNRGSGRVVVRLITAMAGNCSSRQSSIPKSGSWLVTCWVPTLAHSRPRPPT